VEGRGQNTSGGEPESALTLPGLAPLDVGRRDYFPRPRSTSDARTGRAPDIRLSTVVVDHPRQPDGLLSHEGLSRSVYFCTSKPLPEKRHLDAHVRHPAGARHVQHQVFPENVRRRSRGWAGMVECLSSKLVDHPWAAIRGNSAS